MMNFEYWIDFVTLTAVNDPVRVTKSIARGLDIGNFPAYEIRRPDETWKTELLIRSLCDNPDRVVDRCQGYHREEHSINSST
jgi:hypothetical protein